MSSLDEVLEAVAGLRGDERPSPTASRGPARNSSAPLPSGVVEQVRLVDDHDRGPLEELGAEGAELAADGVQRHRPGLGPFAAVEHVHEQRRALDVGEEAVPEPGALAGALDQAGDVGDDGASPRRDTARRGWGRWS